ncbi:unnamed protein product [Prorocentrum cordatum]|uniref:Uncharacterized protein n=1 Tax=Prorocentrum cordatum TaxID=2364126 RepID=A0ABN9XGS4_9DINO|nr:unnamed protein product [Polarella glacialis]
MFWLLFRYSSDIRLSVRPCPIQAWLPLGPAGAVAAPGGAGLLPWALGLGLGGAARGPDEALRGKDAWWLALEAAGGALESGGALRGVEPGRALLQPPVGYAVEATAPCDPDAAEAAPSAATTLEAAVCGYLEPLLWASGGLPAAVRALAEPPDAPPGAPRAGGAPSKTKPPGAPPAERGAEVWAGLGTCIGLAAEDCARSRRHARVPAASGKTAGQPMEAKLMQSRAVEKPEMDLRDIVYHALKESEDFAISQKKRFRAIAFVGQVVNAALSGLEVQMGGSKKPKMGNQMGAETKVQLKVEARQREHEDKDSHCQCPTGHPIAAGMQQAGEKHVQSGKYAGIMHSVSGHRPLATNKEQNDELANQKHHHLFEIDTSSELTYVSLDRLHILAMRIAGAVRLPGKAPTGELAHQPRKLAAVVQYALRLRLKPRAT